MHRLFMYPAMMVPATQTAIIKVFADVVGDIQNAIDPFMGSGTSLLSCMEFGLDVFGQDINPKDVIIEDYAKLCQRRIKDDLCTFEKFNVLESLLIHSSHDAILNKAVLSLDRFMRI